MINAIFNKPSKALSHEHKPFKSLSAEINSTRIDHYTDFFLSVRVTATQLSKKWSYGFIFLHNQVKEYGTVSAGIHRKSPEHGSRTSTGKFSEFFPVISVRSLPESAGKWSECIGKNPEIFRPEYCFHVPVTSGVFLQDPAFFPPLSCRFLRNLVTEIFDLGRELNTFESQLEYRVLYEYIEHRTMDTLGSF